MSNAEKKRRGSHKYSWEEVINILEKIGATYYNSKNPDRKLAGAHLRLDESYDAIIPISEEDVAAKTVEFENALERSAQLDVTSAWKD